MADKGDKKKKYPLIKGWFRSEDKDPDGGKKPGGIEFKRVYAGPAISGVYAGPGMQNNNRRNLLVYAGPPRPDPKPIAEQEEITDKEQDTPSEKQGGQDSTPAPDPRMFMAVYAGPPVSARPVPAMAMQNMTRPKPVQQAEEGGSGVFCPECGTPAHPGAKFCTECGHDLRNSRDGETP